MSPKKRAAGKAAAKKTSAKKTPARNQAALDKGIHEGVKKDVLASFEPSHGPNLSDRSDMVGVEERLPFGSKARITSGDEGKEPGRNG